MAILVGHYVGSLKQRVEAQNAKDELNPKYPGFALRFNNVNSNLMIPIYRRSNGIPVPDDPYTLVPTPYRFFNGTLSDMRILIAD